MSVFETIEKRYSVRKFKNISIPEEKLERILEAGRLAPTAKNIQPNHIYVCKSETALAAIDSSTKCRYGAPLVLVVCYDDNQDWHNPFDTAVHSGEVDSTIIADEMILTAWEEGIGSCWVAWFNPQKLSKELKLQSNIKPVILIPMGYADEDAKPAPRHEQRKEKNEIIHEL